MAVVYKGKTDNGVETLVNLDVEQIEDERWVTTMTTWLTPNGQAAQRYDIPLSLAKVIARFVRDLGDAYD